MIVTSRRVSVGAQNQPQGVPRRDRTKKLQQSDWMANSDVTMTDAWKTYRQQLRDLPSGLDTVDKVNNVTWPSEPS